MWVKKAGSISFSLFLRQNQQELDEIVLQYFENDIRYEFKSRIITLHEEPIDLLVLEYPYETYSADKRNLDRINCLVSARLHNKQIERDSQPVVGVIANINKTGCLCNLAEKEGGSLFSMGDRVNIVCQFPGLVGEQSAEGEIVRVGQEGKDLVLGIRFSKEIWWIPPYKENEK